MPDLFLTFDTEDFISENSVPALDRILGLLKKNELTGFFFITGNMAEKLSNFPETIALLNEHQIGYHSSGHSTHPAIFEFTDVENFHEAYRISLIRETSHINPLTGEIQGVGGINALKSLFPKKSIIAFRAPGYCWSPPHTEALTSFGITYDFSTQLSNEPVAFNGITFYPFPLLSTNWRGGIREHLYLQRLLLRRRTSVLTVHPSTMVNQLDWDLIYYPGGNNVKCNPEKIMSPPARKPDQISNMFYRFDLLLKHIKKLKRSGFLDVTPKLQPAEKTLTIKATDVIRAYQNSIIWASGFGYKPRFLYNHFLQFFEESFNARFFNDHLFD